MNPHKPTTYYILPITGVIGSINRTYDAIVSTLAMSLGFLIEYISEAFSIWHEECIMPWVRLIRTITAFVAAVGSGTIDLIRQIRYLITIRRAIRDIALHLIAIYVVLPFQIAFKRGVDRLIPPAVVLNTLALIVLVMLWISCIYLMIFGWFAFNTQPPQPPPLDWEEQDCMRLHFENTPITAPRRWLHRTDGEVVPLRNPVP
ncbi:uncharacterized protein GGS22DRAFT_68523 [Annulohypoxylon maeteangense]|uniref:uncharacterized protein n=1 Tax=Annulohypoxylon maeteangense TaxID=1927788 RepID=UPI00200744CE|nr:uncharacterized protein GGS22DRAFT_68523 [Annulohypoxylon maeteangense]KAI0889192.1 hypothetical protein GGS22DRAFT_68523 [Annulohypoxylon maeteangense]